MIYKVILILALVTVSGNARASNEVDISGLQSLANDATPSNSRFKGIIGFDSSSFLYTSTARGTSSTTFQATLEDSADSNLFHSQGDLQFYTFVNDKPSIGIESRELFIQTQPQKLGDVQLTLGRKLYEWSKLDRTWTMMSLWSPRWTWDELHPELIGMTGIFGTYTNKNLSVIAFGSPLSIPERGTNVTEVNHQIVSSNPLFRPPPTSKNVLGADTQLSYNLLTPPLQDILFRPNFALRGKYTFDSGYWISANTGVLPINMIQEAAEPYLSTVNGLLQVNIRPQFPMRNINTVETGYDEKDWDVWGSVSYEQPFNFQNQTTWLNPIITPSTIVSLGTDVKLTQNFTFNSAALFIHEQPFTVASDLPAVNVTLPSRFPLKQGIKVGGNWKFSEVTEGNASWIQDLLYQTHLVSFDVEHLIRKANVTLGAGADIIVADTTAGYVGQYYGDDRLRGWLKYAF
jgi:hypothetical protein